MLLGKGRSEIFIVEFQGSFCSPRTSRVWSIGVGFVLVHYLGDRQAFLLIQLDEFAEHICVALQITRVLNEKVLSGKAAWEHSITVAKEFHLISIHLPAIVHIEQIALTGIHFVILAWGNWIIVVDLHPYRWAPWRHEELQIGLILLGRTSQRNDVALVVFYIEVLEGEISIHIVTAIPGTGIVVGIHGNSAVGKLEVSFWRIQVIHHLILFLSGKHIECIPVQFIECCTESYESGSLALFIYLGNNLSCGFACQGSLGFFPRLLLGC